MVKWPVEIPSHEREQFPIRSEKRWRWDSLAAQGVQRKDGLMGEQVESMSEHARGEVNLDVSSGAD